MYVSHGTSPSRPITPSPFQDIHFSNFQHFDTDRLPKRRGSLGSDSRRSLLHPTSQKSAMKPHSNAKVPTGSFVRLMGSGWTPGRVRVRAKEDLSKGFELLWRLKGQKRCSEALQIAVKSPGKRIQVSVRIPSGEAVEDSSFHIARHTSKRTTNRAFKPLSTPAPGLIASFSKHWLSKPRSMSKIN